MIVLDDVHWADLPSLKLLEFVATDLPDARILVVGAYRDTEVQRDHAFFATLSRLAREPATRRLPVGGLSPAHVTRWVEVAGLAGDSSALGKTLHRQTNGNPSSSARSSTFSPARTPTRGRSARMRCGYRRASAR